MDMNTTQIITIVIFALLVLVVALRFRKKLRASIKAGPVKLTVEGENHPPADAPESRGGVRIEDAEAGGGILADASDGGGVSMKRVKAAEDILASASKPDAPKA